MKKIIIMLVGLCLVFGMTIPHKALAQNQTYIVHSGDSLWRIAVKYQVGITELIKANPQFKNPDLIYPGEKVTIPQITAIKDVEKQVIYLTNQERKKRGLAPLTANWELSRVARYKARDMRDNNYFSHQSPTYGSPFTMMKNFGISYNAAAENIAAGQSTPVKVVNAWMNSAGHRRNILNPAYTEIGVGYAKGGSYGYYWSQMFIHP